jgi:hypothetical protein
MPQPVKHMHFILSEVDILFFESRKSQTIKPG